MILDFAQFQKKESYVILPFSNLNQKDPSESDHPKVLPFLRWAGSKKQHILQLSHFWSDKYSRYIEPFASSAVLFFHINPKGALLGEINKELISTLKTVSIASNSRKPRSFFDSKRGKALQRSEENGSCYLGTDHEGARFI
jgi:hypothetical protein